MRRSRHVNLMTRILPRTGYNNYNCPKYSKFTTTYIGTTSTNSLRNGLYPMNKRTIVRGITTVIKLAIRTDMPGITIMHYGNAYTGHSHIIRFSNIQDYHIRLLSKAKRATYTFNYLNNNSYITTYRFNTLAVGRRAKVPRIGRRLYATYNTYMGTYPHIIVRLHPGKPGDHHVTILYMGHSGKTITGGIYGTSYVKYNGYIGMYRFRTVALGSGLTCVSPRGYGLYHGYRRTYPGNTVRTVGFPPHGPGTRAPRMGPIVTTGRRTRDRGGGIS